MEANIDTDTIYLEMFTDIETYTRIMARNFSNSISRADDCMLRKLFHLPNKLHVVKIGNERMSARLDS